MMKKVTLFTGVGGALLVASTLSLQGAVHAELIKPIIITATTSEGPKTKPRKSSKARTIQLAGCTEKRRTRCA